MLELPGTSLPDWRLATLGGGWGDSVLQTVVDTMQDFTTTMRSIAAMVSDGKLDVVKIPDMALNLTTPGYKNKLVERVYTVHADQERDQCFAAGQGRGVGARQHAVQPAFR